MGFQFGIWWFLKLKSPKLKPPCNCEIFWVLVRIASWEKNFKLMLNDACPPICQIKIYQPLKFAKFWPLKLPTKLPARQKDQNQIAKYKLNHHPCKALLLWCMFAKIICINANYYVPVNANSHYPPPRQYQGTVPRGGGFDQSILWNTRGLLGGLEFNNFQIPWYAPWWPEGG